MCTVYLIHLDKPIYHARHYLGYTAAENVSSRLARHKAGAGARLLAHANTLGISYTIVRTWQCSSPLKARSLERKLKRSHNAPRLCPVCKGVSP